MNNSIAAIILTKNEAKHIVRCIRSLEGICDEVIVVDSLSTDNTCELAESMGARVYRNPWKNYATQFNYGVYEFRKGHGDCENRWMDEHIRLFDGKAITVNEGNQVDANLNNLTWWTEKHNGYATREMADMLMMEYAMDAKAQEVVPKLFGTEEQRKRWLKMKYIKSPLFIRPFVNFTIRYILKGGFLDGKEGFIWHILQGFWYRMLVDAKVYELKKQCGWNEEMIKTYLKEKFL